MISGKLFGSSCGASVPEGREVSAGSEADVSDGWEAEEGSGSAETERRTH